MELWEAILLIACVLLTALTVSLMSALKKITQTVENLDKLIEQNTAKIGSITANIDQVTADAKNVTGKISGTVEGIDKIVSAVRSENAPDNAVNIKRILEVGSYVWSAYRFIQERRDRREMNAVIKEAKKKK